MSTGAKGNVGTSKSSSNDDGIDKRKYESEDNHDGTKRSKTKDERFSKVVGVLGGGQLGRMMAYAGHRLGIDIIPLDPLGSESPAGQVCARSVKGSFNDPEAIKELASKVDILTVEIEHVNVAALKEVEDENKIEVHPSSSCIAKIQDKWLQHKIAKEYKVPVTDFEKVENKEDILRCVEKWGGEYPIMLKSRFQAYDGKGNFLITSQDKIEEGLAKLGNNPLYLERNVPFIAELAVMVISPKVGKSKTFPFVETRHVNSICDTVICPPTLEIPPDTMKNAEEIARNIPNYFEGVGVFGVELFLTHDHKILFNEVAPRPHNSGHYTIEACETDQFEQHLRAITGLPLTGTRLKVGHAAMVNVIGEPLTKYYENDNLTGGITLHSYGKAEARPGRKMGHITICAHDIADLAKSLKLLNRDYHLDATKTFKELNRYRDHTEETYPSVGLVMGSFSDYSTMEAAAYLLKKNNVAFEFMIVSAHRTPDMMYQYAKTASQRGIKVIIAGAGGAAHLPGMLASLTSLPVIGVPVKSSALSGEDSLLSIVQMPRGIPVATVAIGNSENAAWLALRILAISDQSLRHLVSNGEGKQVDIALSSAAQLSNKMVEFANKFPDRD